MSDERGEVLLIRILTNIPRVASSQGIENAKTDIESEMAKDTLNK